MEGSNWASRVFFAPEQVHSDLTYGDARLGIECLEDGTHSASQSSSTWQGCNPIMGKHRLRMRGDQVQQRRLCWPHRYWAIRCAPRRPQTRVALRPPVFCKRRHMHDNGCLSIEIGGASMVAKLRSRLLSSGATARFLVPFDGQGEQSRPGPECRHAPYPADGIAQNNQKYHRDQDHGGHLVEKAQAHGTRLWRSLLALGEYDFARRATM